MTSDAVMGDDENDVVSDSSGKNEGTSKWQREATEEEEEEEEGDPMDDQAGGANSTFNEPPSLRDKE